MELECYVYHFVVKRPVETKPAGKLSTTTITTSSRKLQTITWSYVTNDVWENCRLGAQAFCKIPERYVIIKMYTHSRNRVNPSRPGVKINDER